MDQNIALLANSYLGFHYTLAWIVPSLVWVITVWTFFWKGYGLWTAAKNGQRRWFAVILLVNTMGILEIFYLLKFAKKSWSDVKKVLKQNI